MTWNARCEACFKACLSNVSLRRRRKPHPPPNWQSSPPWSENATTHFDAAQAFQESGSAATERQERLGFAAKRHV
jgi:hypothetical protein